MEGNTTITYLYYGYFKKRKNQLVLCCVLLPSGYVGFDKFKLIEELMIVKITIKASIRYIAVYVLFSTIKYVDIIQRFTIVNQNPQISLCFKQFIAL